MDADFARRLRYPRDANGHGGDKQTRSRAKQIDGADETPSTNSRRRIIRQAVIGLLILAVFVSAAWYFTSPQFRTYVRGRLVSQLKI